MTERASALASRITEWLQAHDALVWTVGAASLLLFAGTLVVIPILLVRMPHDYFLRRDPPPESFRGRHPVFVLTVRLVRNAFGALLVLAGLAMTVLPGQGVVTILIGLTLSSFPGKRRLELWIARRKPVRRAIDWIRANAGRPALLFPDDEPEAPGD